MDEIIIALTDVASHVAAFVRDKCRRDTAREIPCVDLFTAWKVWADGNGHRPGTSQQFGRNLRAVVPGLRVVQPGAGDNRPRAAHDLVPRVSVGLELRPRKPSADLGRRCCLPCSASSPVAQHRVPLCAARME